MDAAGLLAALRRRLRPRRVNCYAAITDAMCGKAGLEIGGPSSVFSRHSLLPAYAIAGSIDNVNFGRETVWEGTIQEGRTFAYDARHAPGRQFVLEATDLAAIADGRYDFVLSSHTIEHVANPLRALREWVRTLKGGGLLVLVVPHHEGTFDHRRAVTPMAHLLDDDRRGTAEDDLTHLPEILERHDLSLDPPAGDFASFKARSERNFENRCLHHHVFDERLVAQMLERLECLGTPLVAIERVAPYHIFAVARKPAS
jgi:SAM-dependent methyltransferase